MPTVLDLCEIDYSAESLSVASLSESWGPELSSFHGQPVFSGNLLYYEDRESVIFEGLKYIRFLVTENREELYDLVLDPGESTSLVAELPREAERARALLDAEVATAKKLRQFHDLRPQKGSELDPETIRRLKSLGYIP